jgi:hypothetical protein
VSFSAPSIAQRPRASLPNTPFGATEAAAAAAVAALEVEELRRRPSGGVVVERSGSNAACDDTDQQQQQHLWSSTDPFERVARSSWSREELDRRGQYGVAAAVAMPHGARPPPEASAAHAAAEPIYEVLSFGSDADCFSPAVIPWDDAEQTPTPSPPAHPVAGNGGARVAATPPTPRRELLPLTPPHTPRNSNEKVDISAIAPTSATSTAVSTALPSSSTRASSSFQGATDGDHHEYDVVYDAIGSADDGSARTQRHRRASTVELSTISSTTGETKRWESVQRVHVPQLSLEEAETLLLRHERGPGTFLFRQCNDQVVLTLWDGTRVHHFVIREGEATVPPAVFQEGRRFRDFIREYRGGASGVLPSALRHMVVVNAREPARRRASSFTLHSLYTTTPVPPSCSTLSSSSTGAVCCTTHGKMVAMAMTPSKAVVTMPPRARGWSTTSSGAAAAGLLSPSIWPRQDVYTYDRVLDHTTATHL